MNQESNPQIRPLIMILAGILLNIIGFFVVIPQNGFFGVVTVAAGGALTGMGIAILLGKKSGPPFPGDVEGRLRKLKRLKDEGLITEEEYTDKRKDILAEKW